LAVEYAHGLFNVVHAWEEKVVPLVWAAQLRRYLSPEVLGYAWVTEILHCATRLSQKKIALGRLLM
jgi:hypothetical protein